MIKKSRKKALRPIVRELVAEIQNESLMTAEVITDKTVLIRINSIMGALVVVGNDLNVDEIKEKVTDALVKAYESAQWLIERKNNRCEPTQDEHKQPQSDPAVQNSDCLQSPEDTTHGI